MCKNFSVLAALLLASSALTTVTASAQQHRGGGAPAAAPHVSAAPHFSAPAAPHFSAPAAPHFSAAPHISAAPHFSAAPHYSAAPHFSAAPHVAGPRFTPHFAEHHAAPSFSRHVSPSFAHRNATRTAHAPSFSRHELSRHELSRHELSRHELSRHEPGRHEPGFERHASTPSNTGSIHNNSIRNTANRPNAHTTVGAAPTTTNRAALHQGPGHNRILRNSALANIGSRNPAARNLSNSTFQGRFARSRWGRDWDRDHHHHHHFGFVLGFVGPVFWPYAYDDFVDYTFWPDAYDTFWPYAYDDVFEGLYGAYAPEYGAEYAYAGAPASSRAYQNGGATPGAAATQVCSGETQGLTNFPIEQIARQVQPNQQQQALLDQLKSATEKAVGIMQAACPNDLPSTPTGRLAAMHQRVDAMLQAVQTVRPALDKFYDSLTDEQKERFNALDENAFGNAPQPDVAQLCGQHSPNTALSSARIDKSLRLTNAQEDDLKALNDASAQAAQILSANCPTGQTLTPPGRVAAMEQRLKGMLQAIETVRPALSKFYASLNDEQKARFDRLGRKPT